MKSNGLFASVSVAVCVFAAVCEAQVSQGKALEALGRDFPGFRVRESRERIRQIYGVPMTSGKTAEEAALDWMAAYGAVFNGSEVELREHSVVTSRSGKTVATYTQTIDGVRVHDSIVTVVTHGKGEQTIAYVGARLGDSPAMPWGTPKVTAPQAVQAAQRHEIGMTLTTWATPHLAVTFEEDGKGAAPATLVWETVGGDPATFASYTFFVDAMTGDIARVNNNVVPFDVSGTVRAWATPGLEPDTWEETIKCDNTPTWDIPLPAMLVEAWNGTTLVDSTATDEDGDYNLVVPSSTTVTVKAKLVGPYWYVQEQLSSSQTTLFTDAPPETATATSPVSGVDFQFNNESDPPSTPPPPQNEEFRTANVNAYYHMAKTFDHIISRIDTDVPIPGLNDDEDNIRVLTNGNLPIAYGGAFSDPSQRITWFSRGPAGGDLRNTAFSTPVSHEYGHIILHHMRNVVYGENHFAFHEGFADTLAHLVYDTDGVGHNFEGCDMIYREPLNPPHEYPDCGNVGAHDRGQLLSGIWLTILAEIDATCSCNALEVTRQLHVDWMLLTNGGESSITACSKTGTPGVGLPAHAGTLVEVLTADDDDEDLSDTPHMDEICAAFAAHEVPVEASCEERAPGALPVNGKADCNRDGRIDVADLGCFQSRLAQGNIRADCNKDGRLSAADVDCFRHLWLDAVDHR